MIYNYIDQITSKSLIGRYMYPSVGRGEIFIEFLVNDNYIIENSELIQIAHGKFDLFYNHSKNIIMLNLENLGNAELNYLDSNGFCLRFDDKCLKNGIPKREYSFWEIKGK